MVGIMISQTFDPRNIFLSLKTYPLFGIKFSLSPFQIYLTRACEKGVPNYIGQYSFPKHAIGGYVLMNSLNPSLRLIIVLNSLFFYDTRILKDTIL